MVTQQGRTHEKRSVEMELTSSSMHVKTLMSLNGMDATDTEI